MDLILCAVIIISIFSIFVSISDGLYILTISAGLIGLLSVGILFVICNLNPEITEKTTITNRHRDHIDHIEFSRPVKVIEANYDYPWGIMKDHSKIFIDVSCE